KGKEVYPIGPGGYESRWRVGLETYKSLLKKEMIVWKDNREGVLTPYVKYYLENRTKQVSNLWNDIDGNKKGSIELKELLSFKLFDNPKPTMLINKLIKIAVDNSDIILDFFSGSATTAHATMQLNAEDGGNRKYIMVQLPEPTPENSEAAKAGYKNICEIGKERIRRAGEKIKADETLPLENREKLDTGFKVFKLDTSNIKEWDSETEDLKQTLFDSVDNIKSDRTSLDVLYEILLKYGLDLNVPIVENKDFYSIGGGTLLVNLDKEITLDVIDSICEEYKTLLEIDEDYKTTVVLRDNSFKNDIDKTNAIQKLKQAGIKEIRSI
ncbi:DNA methyltransferase, partial [Cetobacterium sp.]|uniref:DNA methyltransferase n=1 Tax=Cetobacterium sp. TaxID=2071632 RepID=UPI003F3B1267